MFLEGTPLPLCGRYFWQILGYLPSLTEKYAKGYLTVSLMSLRSVSAVEGQANWVLCDKLGAGKWGPWCGKLGPSKKGPGKLGPWCIKLIPCKMLVPQIGP